jgi:DNA primase
VGTVTARADSGTRGGWQRAREQIENNPIYVPGDVLKCLDELGIKVTRVIGDEAVAHCPGHLRLVGKQDAHPSWSVNLESGMHNCFGCGFRGPFAAIAREVLGLNSDDADGWVRARGSLDRIRRELSGEYIYELARKVDTNEADLALFVPPPADVLASRFITAEAAKAYGILYDPIKDCWITPIRDPVSFALWGWQEKAVEGRLFRNYPRHIEKARTLFGIENPNLGRTAVMVEAPLDTAVICSTGWPGALSSFGAGVSDDQMELVIERFDALILALDNDPDGRKATQRVVSEYGRRIPIRVMPYLVEAKDPGEMDDEEIRECLSRARYPI